MLSLLACSLESDSCFRHNGSRLEGIFHRRVPNLTVGSFHDKHGNELTRLTAEFASNRAKGGLVQVSTMASQLLLRGRSISTSRLCSMKANMTGNPLSSASLRSQLNPQQKRYSASWTTDMLKKSKSSMMKSPLPWWLFGTAGLVATTLTVGAAARLTRTGASTLYWKPRFMYSPKTESEWHDEFDVYRDFCARSQRTPMTLEDFKRNYKWESAHHKLGQLTALAFVGPLTYFAMKSKIPIPAQAPLAIVAGLGATQLYIGREMVEKNVKPAGKRKSDHTPMFEGATFFLPVHSALSLASFSLLVWTGLGIISPVSRAISVRGLMTPGALKEMAEVRKHFVALTGLAAGTIFAGSLVAEIDGGREFQTFPKMGDHWIPHGLFEQKPFLRNFHDNVALVQFDHRLLALTTLAAYTAVFVKARKPKIWTNLPEDAKRAMMLAFAAVGGQVFMGATMLVNEVPTPLAMVHQGGAALVLGSSLWVVHSLRFARPGGLMGAAVAAAASKVTWHMVGAAEDDVEAIETDEDAQNCAAEDTFIEDIDEVSEDSNEDDEYTDESDDRCRNEIN
ncbi:hypothetical protein PC129_g7237 [Phytophthora cactorum]|uniref:Uncharacterized protein n=4 Tax=Phytophthora cactorum TaxID=29920 RepID=A0A8T1ICQ9_9STRA|nr:hypothetical protein PC128_g4482 [Phytophthora cactorum]KAG3222063.1 hypothetical protein PC129_g7237 [Phytophthora cactorum]